MLKKSLLGTVALLAIAGTAVAADLPVYQKAPPSPVAAPMYYGSWTGLYGGLQIGYGWDWTGTDFKSPDTTIATLGNSPQGITGGLRLGYDVQLGGPIVLGIVTDINIANFTGTSNNPGLLFDTPAGPLTGHGISTSNTTSWWGTTNVRLGISGFGDHVLPYIVGGAAYGEGRTNVTGANVSGPGFSLETSKTLFGWDAGVGIETRLTKNISAFIEGKYVTLGDVDVPLVGMGTGPIPPTATQAFKFGVVQGGINYRF